MLRSIVRRLGSGNAERVRIEAAKTLAQFKSPRAAEALVAVLRNRDDHRIHGPAKRSLQRIGAPYAVQPLINLLTDPENMARADAADVLGWIKDPRAIEPLRALLADPDDYVRRQAQEAIRSITGTATHPPSPKAPTRDELQKVLLSLPIVKKGQYDDVRSLQRTLNDLSQIRLQNMRMKVQGDHFNIGSSYTHAHDLFRVGPALSAYRTRESRDD